jgi:short-subunit dehydrogenase
MQDYQRALITGASSGIGKAFAERLASTAHLLLSARDRDKLGAAASGLARPGFTVETLAADLTRAEDRDRLIARGESFGIDLLINNAGVGRLGAFLNQPAEEELQTAQLNVVAVLDLTRRLLPGMLERARQQRRRCGLIIVASTAAFAPVPYFATYAASKAFDLHFAEALAEELRGEPVDILALCPGATRTDFGRRAGHAGSEVPGAAEPADVAAGALAALGRQTVHVSGRLGQAAMMPVVLPRRLLTGAVGLAMRLITARQP